MCQKSCKSIIFEAKRASEEKSGKTKKPKFLEMLDLLCLRFKKISNQVELKKMKLCIYLVNYFPLVCAKFHQNWTTFSVRGLARRKVVKAKRTNLPRCLTYSASNPKILSQGERRKLIFYILFSYLPPLCLCQNSSKSNNFRGKRASEEKMVKRKSTNFTRCPNFFASDDKILSQWERRNLRLYM